MTEKSTILEILESTIEDYAQYSCLIENEAGQDICDAGVCLRCVDSYLLLLLSFSFFPNILF